MNVFRIDDVSDARLMPYRNLKATNDTRWTGQFVVEGDKLVRRLLDSDFTVASLLVSQGYLSKYAPLVDASTRIFVVPDDWIEQLVGFNFHRGVLACAIRKPNADLLAANVQRQTIVICPDVQDPENLGALLRISDAFGVNALLLGGGCCDPFSRRVLRVSMGAALRVRIRQTEQLDSELRELRDRAGFALWATVIDRDAERFDALARPERLGLLLGSEGHGLGAQWLALCDRRITIPMQSHTDSLNVSVAAGVMLYHLTK